MTMTLEVPADAEPLTFAEAYRRKLGDGWRGCSMKRNGKALLFLYTLQRKNILDKLYRTAVKISA